MFEDLIVESNFVINETQETISNHEMQNDAIVIEKKVVWNGKKDKTQLEMDHTANLIFLGNFI